MSKTVCKVNCEKYTNAITTAFMMDLLSGKMGDDKFFDVIESISKNMDEGRIKVELGLELISEVSKRQGGGQYLDNARMMEGVIMSYATNDPLYLQQFVNIAKKNATQGTWGKYLSDIVDMQNFISKFALSVSSFDLSKTITEQVMKNKTFQDLFDGVSTQNIAKGLKSLSVFNYTNIKELNRYGVSLVKNFDSYLKDKNQFSPEFYENLGSSFDEMVKLEFEDDVKGKTPEEKTQLFFDVYNRNLKTVLGSSIDDPFLRSVLDKKFSEGKDTLPSFNAIQNYMLFRSINSGVPEADAMVKLLDSMDVVVESLGDIMKSFDQGIQDGLMVSDLRSIIFNNISGFQKLTYEQKLDLMARYKDAIQNEIFKNTGDYETLTTREREVTKVLASLTADFSAGKDIGQSMVKRLYDMKIKKYSLTKMADANPNLKQDIMKQLLGETEDDMFTDFDMTPLQKQLMMFDILGVDPKLLDDITGAIDIVRYVSNIEGITDNVVREVQAIVDDFLDVSDELKNARLSPEGFSIKAINELSNKKDALADKVQQTIDFLQSYQPDGGKYYPQRKILQAFFGEPVVSDNIMLIDTNPLLGQGDDVAIARKKLYMLSQRYELNLPIDNMPVLELTGDINKSARKLFDIWLKSLDTEPVSFIVRQKKMKDPVLDRFYELRETYLKGKDIANKGSVSSPDFGLSVDFVDGQLKIKSANKFDIDNRIGQLEYVRNILTDSKSVLGEQDNTNELDSAMNAYLQSLFGDMDVKNFDNIKSTIMGEDGKSYVDIDTLMKRVNVVNERYTQTPIDFIKEYNKITNLSDETVMAILPDFVRNIIDDTGLSIDRNGLGDFDIQKAKEYMYTIIYGGVDNTYPAKLGLLETVGLLSPKEVETYKISPNSIRDELLYKLDKSLPELRIPYDYNNQYRDTLNYVIDNYEAIQPQLTSFGSTTSFEDLPKNVQAFIGTAFPKNFEPQGLKGADSDNQKAQLVLSRIATAYTNVRNQTVKFTDGIGDIKKDVLDSQLEKNINVATLDNNYKSIIDGESIEKRQAISYAEDIMFDSLETITNEKISNKPLKSLVSEMKSLIGEYKSSLKKPSTYDDISHNKTQQNIFKSRLYNLQVKLASEYGPMYGDTAVKNTFFYYENTIPFVPDVSTYNSIDTYIDNMKKTFDGVEKDIQVKIDDRNKDLTKASKKIPAKQIIEKMMGDGYVTLSAGGSLYRVTRASAIKSNINNIINGLSYIKPGESAYIDSLIEIFKKDELFINKLSDEESKRLYSMLLMSDFAAKVNDPLFSDITNHIKKQSDGVLNTFFDDYIVEEGLPRIMNTPILQGESIIREMKVKKKIFSTIQSALKDKTPLFASKVKGSFDKVTMQKYIREEVKAGKFTPDETQLLYDNLVNIVEPYPILQRSEGIELLYNDKKLSKGNTLGEQLQNSKDVAITIRNLITDGEEKEDMINYLKGIEIGTDNYTVNLGEFFDNLSVSAHNADTFAKDAGIQLDNQYMSFDFMGKYIDGTQPKEKTFFTKEELSVIEDLSDIEKKHKESVAESLSCIL